MFRAPAIFRLGAGASRRRVPSVPLALALLGLGVAALPAVTLEVHNSVGDVSIEITHDSPLRIRSKGRRRAAGPDDVKVGRAPGRVLVQCAPADNAPIDLDITAPLGFSLRISTDAGAVSVKGIARSTSIVTQTGDVFLSAPWRSIRIQMDADSKPAELSFPKGVRFSRRTIEIAPGVKIWRLRDRIPEWKAAYGRIDVKAGAPRSVTLAEYEVPEDSPLKFPWQAPALLDEIVRRTPRAPSAGAPSAKRLNAEQPGADAESGELTFRSDVRMVHLMLAVSDAQGRPALGLTSEDFEVIEDGVAQQVDFAGADQTPFNLAVLLDLSGSTKPDRASMGAAAERFVSMAGAGDRVGVYALADGVFHVVASLTAERERVKEMVRTLPDVSGASPLYDMIVLAYAEDLRRRPTERNALIVISDGIDNQVSGQELPSATRFNNLRKGVAEMNALIYPVFLLSGERFGRGWSRKARKRMQQLADASGGRLFPAASIHDLEPVFPLIEAELRAVYSVAYYPANQNFDGGWRGVEVRVKRPGARVRSRAGYYAR